MLIPSRRFGMMDIVGDNNIDSFFDDKMIL